MPLKNFIRNVLTIKKLVVLSTILLLYLFCYLQWEVLILHDNSKAVISKSKDNKKETINEIDLHVKLRNERNLKASKNSTFAAKNKSSKLLLFVGILSANIRRDRREAIRKTWMRQCKSTNRSECRFFADKLDQNGNIIAESNLSSLQRESEANDNDLILLDSPSGKNFALRLFAVMEYLLNLTTDFEYFLRIDDDQFLCFDRLLFELPHRPKEGLYWGHTHCYATGNYIYSKFHTVLVCSLLLYCRFTNSLFEIS